MYKNNGNQINILIIYSHEITAHVDWSVKSFKTATKIPREHLVNVEVEYHKINPSYTN